MNKSKEVNPRLEVGDRIIFVSMQDPYSSITIGTRGEVIDVGYDPWSDEPIYSMKWDNGSTLKLIGDEDVWLKEDKNPLNESVNITNSKLCETFSEGTEFCKKLSEILRTGKGGAGTGTLKKGAIRFFKHLIQSEHTGLGKKIELSPGVKQFDKRLKELKKFLKILKKNNVCKKMQKSVFEDIKNVVDKKLKMVVDEDEQYSVLNRIDTHYTFRSYILTKAALDLFKGEEGVSIDSLNNEGIVDLVTNTILKYKTNELLDELSLTYINDLINKSLEDDSERDMLISNLELSRSVGNKVEDEAIQILKSKKYKVYNFSQDFGFIDHFGVDMLVKDKNTVYPTQVSTGRKINPKIYEYVDDDCECWAIYKANKRFRKEVILEQKENMINEENFIDRAKKIKPILDVEKGNSHIFNFLKALRESGVMNMYESPTYTWGGRDALDKYLKIQELTDSYQQIEDEVEREELLNLARLSQSNMVQAAFNSLEERNMEPSVENINRALRQLGLLAFQYYSLRF